jgi:NAD(P)-dependent dehydrogenase (short-subunit alcohol dehydrogenase family)
LASRGRYALGVLDGTVAIVTGGTSGIGARAAELFLEEGAQVVIAGRRHQEGEAVAKQLGPPASFMRRDVANEPGVKAMIDHALDTFRRLDGLFSNAGNPGRLTCIAELEREDFDAIMPVHVWGVMLGITPAAPVMLVYGDSDMFRPEHIVKFYQLLSGGLKDAGWMHEAMSQNRLAILPDLTHYEIFFTPELARTALPFLNGESRRKS